MLISVYLPTKDRVDLLRVAVESVLCQSWSELELIVIDDGSSDGTPAYLADLVRREPRVAVIRHDTPQGAPRSRNEAILRSRGEFVTGLDDDDEFLPERLRAFVDFWAFMTSHGYSPAFVYAQDVVVRSPTVRYVWRKAGQAMAEDMYSGNYVGNQVFAPRQHYIDAGLFDERLSAWQDLEFYLRMLKKYGTAYLLDMATYVFNNAPRDDRITNKGREKIMSAYRTVASAHADSRRRRERLLLQVFSDYYGFRPTLKDWLHFLSLRPRLEATLKMVHASLR